MIEKLWKWTIVMECKAYVDEQLHIEQKWKLDEGFLPWSVFEVLVRYAQHYGVIMHTSITPTGQRSRF